MITTENKIIGGIFGMKLTKSNPRKIYASTQSVTAADEDLLEEDEFEDEELADSIDSLSDTADDLQEQIEDVEEDKVSIEVDNNITNHYIAECDGCKGIFISAVPESDQNIESISGICPLCNEETDQTLKWVIRDKNDDNDGVALL